MFSSDYSAINEKDEDKMTDSNSSNKAAPPKFSGQADDYIDWRRQFAAHMRDEKGININKRAADGTLALSDAKKWLSPTDSPVHLANTLSYTRVSKMTALRCLPH